MPDLFGDIVVTLDDVLSWMLAVPGIPPTSPRFAYYARFYNVIEKIKAAKAAGTFDRIVEPTDEPETNLRLYRVLSMQGRLARLRP